ncbi:AAA family ATPase [Sinimarinibacterium flocculans]|uniref:AAA family ATPase n=1 Tax=Sinimarinibacterium flocculans TaxID=985250 RepID=UPI003514962F
MKVKDESVAAALQTLHLEVAACTIVHPGVARGLELMEESYQNAVDHFGRRGVMIHGESRSGKTKLLELFRTRFENVTFLSLTGAATVDSVVSDLLRAVGDPLCTSGTIANKTERLESLIAQRGTRMIQIDEAHHVIMNRSPRVVGTIASWLKSLMNDRIDCAPKNFALVLSGVGEVTDLLRDEQLRNRFYAPIELQLFTGSDEVDVRGMRVLLASICKQLTIARNANLSTTEMALRFRMATTGRIGIVVDLVAYAGSSAIRDGRDVLTASDLGEAYDVLVGSSSGDVNPFRTDVITLMRDSRTGGLPAPTSSRRMNRRIRAAKKETKIGDVLKRTR